MNLFERLQSWRRRRRDPTEVFTPKSVVTREMFERRNEPDLEGNPGLQDLLQRAIRDPGGQVLIYGDTGVGKSSLLKYAAEDESRKMVSIECFSERTYEQLMEECIARIVDFQEVSFADSYGVEAQLELGVGTPRLMTAKGTTKSTFGRTRNFSAVQKEPIEILLQATSMTGQTLIVLDNFQNVDPGRTRKLIAQTMERLSDRAGETADTKIVVIGISDDPESLLVGAGSFTRRTAEVGVPRMPPDEIRRIFGTGFTLLGLEIGAGVLDEFVFYSDGFPYFAHLLGQSAAQAARRAKEGTITKSILGIALNDAANQVQQGYAARVRLALEKGGDVQPRKRILELFAYDERQEWSAPEAVALFEEAHGARNDTAFLHTALAQLTGENHGEILKRSGSAGRYLYRFRDPHMRPYLRLSTFPRVNGSSADAK